MVSNRNVAALGWVLAVLASGGVLAGSIVTTERGGVTQPIAFNHNRHVVGESMECTTCHTQVAKGPRATIPGFKVCMLCHEEPKGSHPDEPKIREYAAQKAEIPWVRVHRLKRHVYFSHLRHVTLGKIDCTVCHGDVRSMEKPFTRPAFEAGQAGMDRCVECHRKEKVTTDCLACHR